jgi:hypothetical protein
LVLLVLVLLVLVLHLMLLHLMLMVVVEIHEHLGEKMLVLLMKVLMLRCPLIESWGLMHHYSSDCALIEGRELLFHCLMDLMQYLLEQILIESVLLVLLMSFQMLDLLHQLLFQVLYLFQFVVARQLHFVCFLIDLVVELVAFPVVVVVLQEFVL